MDRRITVKDLARIAGVDHSTVSRALNDSPRVNEATRRRIKELAEKHNFRFNSNARSLSRKKTGVIGVIYPAEMEDFSSSLYTNRLFMELRRELEKYQLDGILIEAYHPETGESNTERLIRQQKVDGFLIIHSDIAGKDYELMRRWELPVVQVHLKPNDYSYGGLDYFFTDNRRGGELAAGHLAGSGCRRFFNISIAAEKAPDTPCMHSELRERTEGFLATLADAGDDLIVKTVYLDGSFRSARDLILSGETDFQSGDGLFFHSDLMALGALTALNEEGRRVPEEIRLIGFDDSPISTLMEKGITTIHQPGSVIAAKAAFRINQMVEDKYRKGGSDTREQELLEPVLIKRETT